MSTFPEYSYLDLAGVHKAVLQRWKDQQVFEQTLKARKDAEPWIFFEGPPSANGLPGIHHVMGRSLKDVFCRYKTQKGFLVDRKAGWDTHGLPVELGVEKELGITKEDIGKSISIEEYNEACKNAVMRYTGIWKDLTDQMGYWVDMDDPYVTYDPKYMESVWWLLSELYNKGLIYKGYTIQPYSPKAGTGLSSHELNQPGCYRDVKDNTVVAQFKMIKSEQSQNLFGDEAVHFLAWTTTPWTLPSNTALTVGPKIEYVWVKSFNQYTFEPITVILAKSLVGKQFSGKYNLVESEEELKSFNEGDKKIPYFIGDSVLGSELKNIRYEQLIDAAKPYQNPENAFRVILGDFVTTEDGTGIVHTAPTFGADDAQAAKEADPEVPPMLVLDENGNPVPLVDLQGKFRPELGELGGKYVKNDYYEEGEAPEKSVDVEIAIQLKTENKAFKVEKYVHSYPNCWRTDKPVLYYPLDSWFIKVTDIKDRMVELNQSINWKPKATGEGRFGNWLSNANDWNLSRSRYWGIPLPIWRTEDGKEERIIGSVQELKEAMQEAVTAGFMEKDIFEEFKPGDNSEENYQKIDLHKNIVDQIVLLSESGKPMRRESDLIDVWFDSGSMPYAQWHYPFENKEKIDNNTSFPADFIAEGVDQTRGWFYTLHAIASMVFDSVAYKNVVSNGLVLDKNGQKMSKRLGNAIDPFETIEAHGADATRWYMISNANPWDNLKFDLEGVAEVKRKFFGTLYNTYSFFSLYANLDKFSYQEEEVPMNDRPEIDRWILSELNTLIQKVDECFEQYDATRATRFISDFVQENLSNWYVRLGRRRFWKGSFGDDKLAAYQTLSQVLKTTAQLIAPVAPFFAERLYRDLNGTESVHLSLFPTADTALIDKTLEEKMQLAQKVSSLVLSIRQKEKIKVRQPLQRVMIPVSKSVSKEAFLAVSELIRSEVNVKEVSLLEDASDILVKEIKPNFKTLGPKYGPKMKQVAFSITSLNQEQIQQFEQEETCSISLDDSTIELSLEDVFITNKDIEGWLVASHGALTVALDITLSETLINEGIARELVNRIQNLRKDSGLEVTDKILLNIEGDEAIEKAVEQNREYLMNETLCEQLELVEGLDKGIAVSFDDIETQLYLKKK